MRNKLKKINPCDESHSEESLVWRIMCALFPDCWCCAGVRGVVYGAFLVLVVFGLLEFL